MTDQINLFEDLGESELDGIFSNLEQFEASPDENAQAAQRAAEEALKIQTRDKVRELM
jgi:hypothetical protein